MLVNYHPWQITEDCYLAEEAAHHASLFALGNGYLGLRGSQEDMSSTPGDGLAGTYLNGFYESKPITYGEIAYGYATHSETLVNLANPLPVELYVNGNRFDPAHASEAGQIQGYTRILHMNEGRLTRSFIWDAPDGCRLFITSTRFTSLDDDELGASAYHVELLKGNADESPVEVELRVHIDSTTTNKRGDDDPRVSAEGGALARISGKHTSGDDQTQAVLQKTLSSELHAAVGTALDVQHISPSGKGAGSEHGKRVQRPEPVEIFALSPGTKEAHRLDDARLAYSIELQAGDIVALTKYIAVSDSRRQTADGLLEYVLKRAREARKIGYNILWEVHCDRWAEFWSRAQVSITGDLALLQGVNFNMFQLRQSPGRDGITNIAAKGLSGEGYEGHYFWDTEMYMLPFFVYTEPEIARDLLSYRFHILDHARERARTMGHARGALFPWRTISGRECSAYYPAGSAQYHINGDVGFAIKRYITATEDYDYAWEEGLEILIETAVFWLDLGFYNPSHDNKFCIQMVTGPDEYNVLVDNNFYTNLLAAENMAYAAELTRHLAASDAKRVHGLYKRLGYDLDQMLNRWDDAATNMFYPYDEATGLPLQDDKFLDREPWDFANVPRENYPLLLHYHPLYIYRHQVCKQGDMVLAMYLRPDLFSEETRAAYNYYEACTTHDSSLSASVFSIMANRLGYQARAFRYMMETARLDLDNTHQNTADGLHLANMAGTWLALVHGYGGVTFEDGALHLSPNLPEQWDSFSFRQYWKGELLQVEVRPREVHYELLSDGAMTFFVNGEEVTLDQERRSVSRPVRTVERRRPPAEAVIFDVDGVLLTTDEAHYQAWQRLADDEGIPFDREVNQYLRGVSRRASLDIILGSAGVEDRYDDAARNEMTDRKNSYYREIIEHVDESALLPEVRAFVEELIDHGIQVATASSSRNAETLLEKTDMLKYFDVRVDGTHITRSKPDPQVFQLAAEQLGVAPEQCVVIEDAVAGVEAAQAGGMRSFAVGDAARNMRSLHPDRVSNYGLEGLSAQDILDID